MYGPYTNRTVRHTVREGRRVTDGVPMREAADRLGISVAAVRQRIRRGTLESFKGEDGRWYVRIPIVPNAVPDGVPDGVSPADDLTSALLDTLRSENAFLRGEMEVRNRELADRTREVQELHVMLQTAQRLIPANVPTTSDAARADEQGSPRQHTPVAPGGVQREIRPSWWRRLFGME